MKAESTDFALGLVITDTKFNILFYNDYFRTNICKKNEEILNKKLTIYFHDIKDDENQNFYSVKYIDNSVYYVVHNELKLYEHELFVFFFYDITIGNELEKQINRLSGQQYLYNEMLNKLKDGIYITDEEGTTTFVNDAFLNLSGLTREQIIGKSVYDLKKQNVLPNSCCAKVIETRGPVSTINNYYKGQRCLVSGSPIFDEKGNLKKTIAVIRDVSELDVLMKNITKEKNLFIVNDDDFHIKIKDAIKEPINNNEKMKSIYNKAKKIANVDSTVLVLGETGVGKDFIASYIYNISKKNKGKFIKINCGAVPEHLLESEFFGYEEGAFTGAQKGGKKGLFEEANGGILYLDEIGDMPYTLQVKLLSAINDRMFYRIGGISPVEFNARIIAATNVDLKHLVDEKKFRSDLYYRLNVVSFVIPPLRQRKEDIIPLSQKFIEYYNNKYGKNCYFTTGCLESFLVYEWPGNIRELKNIIERLVLMTDEASIDKELFREQLMLNDSPEEGTKLFSETKTLKDKMDEYEKVIIETTLASSKNMKEAAAKLGIDLSTLVRKKQKYNM
jgi:PAS domain S-box-containing protein